MSEEQQQTREKRGALIISRREGERIFLSLDGRSLGYIEVARIAGEKVGIALVLDKRVRIGRDFEHAPCDFCGVVQSLGPKGVCTHCEREMHDDE